MENKYYIPKIEEFHIGFEFEKHDDRQAIYSNYPNESTTTSYHRFKYDLKSIRLSQLGTHLFEKTIRVKYLDQQDIESLGWEKGTVEVGNNTLETFNLGDHSITSTMEGYNNTKILDISWIGPFKTNVLNRVFRGTIKNKSELIKLMQQLNIK